MIANPVKCVSRKFRGWHHTTTSDMTHQTTPPPLVALSQAPANKTLLQGIITPDKNETHKIYVILFCSLHTVTAQEAATIKICEMHAHALKICNQKLSWKNYYETVFLCVIIIFAVFMFQMFWTAWICISELVRIFWGFHFTAFTFITTRFASCSLFALIGIMGGIIGFLRLLLFNILV